MATVVIDQHDVPVGGGQSVLSPDGSKIAFVSARADLVSGDTNGQADIFIQDLASGAIVRVSTAPGDGEANRASGAPVFSPDGTKLAFVSEASNLVAGDFPWTADFFVKYLATGEVRRVATGADTPEYAAGSIVFSPDGATVMFTSASSSLVSGDSNGSDDIFTADLASGTVTRVSTDTAGEQANGESGRAVFSPDGSRIAFVSKASNLVPGDTNGQLDVFAKDLATGVVERFATPVVSFISDASVDAVFSPDGSHLAFSSGGALFLQDLTTGERTQLLGGIFSYPPVVTRLPVFSPDGTKIAFWSDMALFDSNAAAGERLFVKDLVSGSLVVAASEPKASHSSVSWIGDKIAFASGPTDDPTAFVPSLSFVTIAPLDAVKPEGNSGYTDFTFAVTRSGDLSQPQSVTWALKEQDYASPYFHGTVPPPGTLDFAPGETTKTIVIRVPGDNDVEDSQTFHVVLSNPTGGLFVADGSADGRILNDDMRVHDDAYLVAPGQTLHVPAVTWGTLPPVYDYHPPYFGGGVQVTMALAGGTLLAGGVLANDQPLSPTLYGGSFVIVGPDGTPAPPLWTASLVEGPAHGTLSLAADGSFDYTPDAGFSGVDHFTYNAAGPLGQADGQALILVVPQINGSVPTLDLLALTPEQQVAATYIAFFDRAADAAGFEFWVDQFHAGQATQAPATLFANIASSFAVGAEAVQRYPFLANPHGASDTDIGWFLSSVYGNLFGRGVDNEGKAYWTDQIRQKMADGVFVGSVLVDIIAGAQNSPEATGPHDALALMGRVAVSLAYVEAQQTFGMHWTVADNLIESRLILDGVREIAGTVLTGIAKAENAVLDHVLGH